MMLVQSDFGDRAAVQMQAVAVGVLSRCNATRTFEVPVQVTLVGKSALCRYVAEFVTLANQLSCFANSLLVLPRVWWQTGMVFEDASQVTGIKAG